jgi:hypothetical protein
MERMTRSRVAALSCCASALLAGPPALAANADGGTEQACQEGAAGCTPDDAELRRELERALQEDAKAAQKAGRAGTSAPAEATQETPPPPQPMYRGWQSLNPDISAIIDATGGIENRTPAFRAGDDPLLRSTATAPGAGFTVQEVELALSAIVDPYLKGEVYLTIPNLQTLEIEEAFATTTSLPFNLQIRAGSFRSAFGRQNGQHLHVQDFTRRPLVNAAFLGLDGLRGPGAQVSWLTPLPFYVALVAEAFSIGQPAADLPVASFGGGKGTNVTTAGEAKAFFPFDEEWSVSAGLSSAFGVSPNSRVVQTFPPPGANALVDRRSVLFGGDLYVKWKPLNVSGSYQSLAWQTEVIFRHLGEGNATFPGAGPATVPGEWDGGLYSQVVYQFARRWLLGVRGDVLGLPVSSAIPRTLRGAVSLTFQASEFSRLRAYAEVEHLGNARNVANADYTLAPDLLVASDPRTSAAAYLQLEISIGAHGAHPY